MSLILIGVLIMYLYTVNGLKVNCLQLSLGLLGSNRECQVGNAIDVVHTVSQKSFDIAPHNSFVTNVQSPME